MQSATTYSNISRLDKDIKKYAKKVDIKKRSQYFEAWRCDLSIQLKDIEALANSNYELIRQLGCLKDSIDG